MAKASTTKESTKTTKATAKVENNAQNGAAMSKDEQIGFHKGSLSTLIKERQELLRMVSIVEQLIQMHTGALGDLGVREEAQVAPKKEEVKKTRVPIDELI